MRNLQVYRNKVLAGVLTEEPDRKYSFRYETNYFTDPSKADEVDEKHAERLIRPFLIKQDRVEVDQRSFLSDATRRAYLLDYNTKRNNLNKI